MTAQQIIAEIDAHLRMCGGKNPHWFVGVTSDVKRRLFTEHRVDPHSSWVYRVADSTAEARAVADAYHKVCCDGMAGGAEADAVMVYAYRKTSRTVP